jgi:hypothetical protein
LNKIRNGKKILNEEMCFRHSDGVGEDGEDWKQYLKPVILKWKKFVDTASNGNGGEKPSVSEENKAQAEEIIGISAPVGIDASAQSRTSSRIKNDRIPGLNLVDRGKAKNRGATIDLDADTTDDETPASKKTKKRKTSKNVVGSDTKGTVDKHNEMKENLVTVISDLSTKQGDKGNDPKIVKSQLDMKENLFDKKQAFSREKLTVKMEYKSNKLLITNLTMQKSEAIAKYAGTDDVFLKELYKSDINMYSEMIKQHMENSLNAIINKK